MEWIDVRDWGLRHPKPGARDRNTSSGCVRTDDNGVVTHVAGRTAEGVQQGAQVEVQLEHPDRDALVGMGYLELVEYPIEGVAAERPTEKRTVAPVTSVETQKREMVLPGEGDGEMGAPTEADVNSLVDPIDQLTDPAASKDDVYDNPFGETAPPGTTAPDFDEAKDAIQSGAATPVPGAE